MSKLQRDVIADLRASNPQSVEQLPSYSKARLWARIEEKIMTDSTKPSAVPLRWLLAFSGTALAAAAAAFIFISSPTPSLPTGPSVPLGNPTAICADMASMGGLQARDFAFDGTVTAIDGDQVTFSINESFIGSGNQMTLSAPELTGETAIMLGSPALEIGSRYLVAGDDNFVWTCGFTQTYSTELAADWAAQTR